MSDFDKEAEREKLREKYGEEEEKRAATEQMSELLLKGATMTNAHCTDCGDPIFRYDGQEFCPTCQKPVTREPAEDGEADDGEQGDHIEVADPSDDATVQFGGDGADASEDADRPEPTAAGESTPDQPSVDDETAASERVPDATREADQPPESHHTDQPPESHHTDQPTEARASTSSTPARGDGQVTAELSAAESVLAETVHRFARRAAETDDPRRARDHLAAAREAAEALDAVRF